MENFNRITPNQAHEIIGSAKVTIVDIRDADSFEKGHIPEAQMVNDANIEEFLKVSNKDNPLICYCYHGHSSKQAAQFFANQGFKQVYSIDGGWDEYKRFYA